MPLSDRPLLHRLRDAAQQPIDPASLIFFRLQWGLVMCWAMLRFVAKGWVYDFYVEPTTFFPFFGLDGLRPLPYAGMLAIYLGLALAAFLVAFGIVQRLALNVFLLGFVYCELLDKTNYLNHYYLVTIVAGVLWISPLGRWKIGDLARPQIEAMPAWWLWVFRAQLGLVYFYAGVAKLNTDWLWRAEPLKTWLIAASDLPLVGPWLAQSWVAFAMSWAGVFFDLTIVGWLLWRRTRIWAFVAVVVFHVLTAKLFYLGMFPWMMMGNALVFFPADWPRRLWRGWERSPHLRVAQLRTSLATRWRAGLLALHFVAQVLLPLRAYLYPGFLLWTEQGFRFSWRVMLVEKSGYVIFRVQHDGASTMREVYPQRWLTANQLKMMATQPDMILAMAHKIAGAERARGHRDVRVYADAFVALNGRPSQRLIDPEVDLAAESDSLAPKSWILPLGE